MHRSICRFHCSMRIAARKYNGWNRKYSSRSPFVADVRGVYFGCSVLVGIIAATKLSSSADSQTVSSDQATTKETVLHYWEGRGRAEIIRYMLGFAGVEFKDNYMRGRADFENLMPDMVFGQVPLLQIDGINIIQTHSIIRYIAENNNMMPDSMHDRTRCNQFLEGLRDMEGNGFVGRNWNTPDNPDAVKQIDEKIQTSLKKWLPKFEGLLNAVSPDSGYLINTERPYLCDYYLFYLLNCTDELDYGKRIMRDYPRIIVFFQQMRERSEVKAHLASSHVHAPTTAQYKKEVMLSLGRC